MYSIDKKTSIDKIEEFKDFSTLLMYNSYVGGLPATAQSFENLEKAIPAWKAESMITGMERLREQTLRGRAIFDVYEETEYGDDRQKEDVKIWFLPTEKESNKPFVIINAGGEYKSVCSMVEAFPTAVRFNEMGYHVFVLNYRIDGNKVMPKPLEDLAAAYKKICTNKEIFHVEERYIVCGFSAGANLTCLWGTEKVGYKYYDVRKPEALIPVYPLISCRYMYDNATKPRFITTMFGKDSEVEEENLYDVENQMTKEYPPCYIVHCMDDDMVPAENSKVLKRLLDRFQIQAVLELGAKGQHGFGEGVGTDVEGWIGRAVEFIEKL